jgi:hypothetical protein
MITINNKKLNLFKDSHYAKVPPGSSLQTECEIIAENMVKMLFTDNGIDDLPHKIDFFNRAIIGYHQELYVAMKNKLQETLNQLFENHLKKRSASHTHGISSKQIRAVLYHILAILPFAEPKDGDSFNVPQKIKGQWVQIPYTVERIPLIGQEAGTTYNAYGLVPPAEIPHAQALLLFMGTNPLPSAEGGGITFWADFLPGLSVGEAIFLHGRDKINNFINRFKKIRCVGQSLGGSLSLLVHESYPTKVSCDAIAPPLLLNNRYAQNIAHGEKRRHCSIYTQEDDIVFKIGNRIPDDAKIFHIKPKKGTQSFPGQSHACCFSAVGGSTITQLEKENVLTFKRKMMTVLWQCANIFLSLLTGLYLFILFIVHQTKQLFSKIKRKHYLRKNTNSNQHVSSSKFTSKHHTDSSSQSHPITKENLLIIKKSNDDVEQGLAQTKGTLRGTK